MQKRTPQGTFEQVRKLLVTGIRSAQILLRIDCLNAHDMHQACNSLSTYRIAHGAYHMGHPGDPVKRGFDVLFINDPHQLEIYRFFNGWLVIITGPTQPQQFALPEYRNFSMFRINKFFENCYLSCEAFFLIQSNSTFN
jgi:hypothetical protein